MKKYTQADAERLAKQVRALQQILHDQQNNWTMDWPDSTLIGDLEISENMLCGAIRASRKLKHAVVVTEDRGYLYFHASRLPLV